MIGVFCFKLLTPIRAKNCKKDSFAPENSVLSRHKAYFPRAKVELMYRRSKNHSTDTSGGMDMQKHIADENKRAVSALGKRFWAACAAAALGAALCAAPSAAVGRASGIDGPRVAPMMTKAPDPVSPDILPSKPKDTRAF
jgi:hypothetical protein